MVENSPDFIYVFQPTPVPHFKYVNPSVLSITGYTPEECYAEPGLPIKMIHPADRSIFESLWLFPQPVGAPIILRLIRKDNKEIWTEQRNTVIYDKDGNVNVIVGLLRDVTNQVHTEKHLRQSEQRLRSFIDHSTDGIALIDETGRVVEWNQSEERFTGLKRQEVLGRPIWDVLHQILPKKERSPSKYEQIKKNMRQFSKTGQAVWLNKLRNHYLPQPDGKYRIIQGLAFPIRTGKGFMTGKISRDITTETTTQKLMEQKLRMDYQLFQNIIEFLPDATLVINNKQQVIAWNRAIEIMTGISKENIIGKGNYLYASPFYGMPRPMLIDFAFLNGEAAEIYKSIERKGLTVYHETYVPSVFKGKGAYLWGTASPLYDDKGNLIGAIESIRDMTDHKNTEEQLKYLSLYDSLTGLYNRSYFEQEMSRIENSRHTRAGIIVCDLDNLKLVNDIMGHNAGDTMIVVAANVIRAAFREEDTVARIGGDEFAILLPDCDRTTVESAAKRIKNCIKRYNATNPKIPLSISIGFAARDSASKTSMREIFKEADNNMYREKLYNPRNNHKAVVETLKKILEERDICTGKHAARLKKLVASLASVLGLPGEKITALKLLAQFHDIGKIYISDNILNKPGPLNHEEIIEMQRHCELGGRIVLSVPELAPIADWIRKHHEWWNGKGYPFEIKGENIPLECRILAIADAYDAMTSDRPYRKAMTHEQAVAELKKFAGIQFDPELVTKFLEIIK